MVGGKGHCFNTFEQGLFRGVGDQIPQSAQAEFTLWRDLCLALLCGLQVPVPKPPQHTRGLNASWLANLADVCQIN